MSLKYFTDKGLKVEAINDQHVTTIADFAKACNKRVSYIYGLIRDGNSRGKLKCVELAGRKFIPISEFNNFAFVDKDAGYHVYTFDEEGQKVPQGSTR